MASSAIRPLLASPKIRTICSSLNQLFLIAPFRLDAIFSNLLWSGNLGTGQNQNWSMDFVSDGLVDVRRQRCRTGINHRFPSLGGVPIISFRRLNGLLADRPEGVTET